MAGFPAVPGIAVPGAATPADPGSSAAGAGAALAASSTLTAGASPGAGAALAASSTLTAGGGVSNVQVVNQWAVTFAQPSAFGTTPPALQSTVIALNGTTSVGGGSGVPAAGNWLFLICGWNQAGLAAATAGAADDIHSFWRPGNVDTSAWAVSSSAGKTRAAVWYTANLARQAGDVYAAPNGAMAGRACLVIEVNGLGPWDTVTGVAANYAAAATSVNLTLGAPAAASFALAAVCGDSTAAGQAFAPAGWTALHAVSASNGADHTCDAVLTSAFLPSTSGSVSVSGSASSAADLSAVIIEVQINAASPVPGGANPAWPGRVILEAAFGSGFETPPDQMTWTKLSDSAWGRGDGYKRFWSWADNSGVPYALGQLQSGTGTVELDNADGALSPSSSGSPFYPGVTTGVPVRLRCALGTIGGVPYNRWHAVTRNALKWPERRNKALRGFVPLSLTDMWSVASIGACATPYRGEIYHETSLYSWWAMDDQPLAGGVQPTSLRNSAPGNTTVMSVVAAPGGVSSTDPYSVTGTSLYSTGLNIKPPPNSVATYAVGQQPGWMHGDPQSSPSSYATSNPVTSSPGSAAWQQTGLQGSGGTQGWYLVAHDPGFPALSSGITVKGWFYCGFAGSATGYTRSTSRYQVAAQPYSPITLCTLSTASLPVFQLQLDQAGHLNAVTFSGSAPTSSTVYSASDLRNNAWVCVDIQLTTTTWKVLVNGGLTASSSGSAAGMASAWSYLTLGGDYGTSAGGSSPASLQHGGNVAYSHWKVFSSVLPAWRLLAHYCAAITGFGLLPAPQSLSLSAVANEFQGQGYVPDGSEYQGRYGNPSGTLTGLSQYAFSCVAVAQAGSYTSGPSARAVTSGYGTDNGGVFYGDAVWAGLTALAPSVGLYTAPAAAAETNAATVCGSGGSFISGYGASASGGGACQTASGTGAAYPAAASSLGDTVAQRIERILGYGRVTAPARAIDSDASLLVQAALDVGGQAAGASVQNMVDSDNGLLYTGTDGVLHYRSRPHLAADQAAGPVWDIGMNTAAGQWPFGQGITFGNDPQQVFDAVAIQPYSPDGASLASLTPAAYTTANAAQTQLGVRPKQITSYLQDSTKIQAAADWWLATFGALRRRVETITVNAETYPAAWPLILAGNPGDIIQVYDAPFGAPATTGLYRISSISRKISYSANGSSVEASATITADPLPASYWS